MSPIPLCTRLHVDPSRWLGMPLFLVLCLSLTAVSAGHGEAADPQPHLNTITGVLESIDQENQKAVLRTDLGQSMIVTVTDPELIDHVHTGDRITVQMSPTGELIKVIETPLPELRGPVP